MRNPYRCIYTSSYDRGLEHLLKIWPDVKKAVPKAELHVFYGWMLFERFYGDNPERMAWMKKMNELMEQDGITHHGRVSQSDVAKEMEKSGVWAYPTHFGEISCITAMKAQALGSIPVIIDYAALETTVKFGVKVKGDIYDKETKKKYTEELVAILKNHKKQEEIRKPMMKWAREYYKWSNIAKQWSDLFKSEDGNKQTKG